MNRYRLKSRLRGLATDPENTVMCLMSGGMDSTVLAARYLRLDKKVVGIFINYGQSHLVKELVAFSDVAKYYSIPVRVIDIPPEWGLGVLTSSLISDSDLEVPEVAYSDTTQSTYVPFRNPLFVSIIAALAYDLGIPTIAIGIHSGDSEGIVNYPDCTKDSVDALSKLVECATDGKVKLDTPFLTASKKGIARVGTVLKVPFELTWSCYKGENGGHCGLCSTCIEREEALLHAQEVLKSAENYVYGGDKQC